MLGKILKDKCIKQTLLARKLGISHSLLTHYVKGTRRISLKNAKMIADILGMGIEDIFFAKDNINNINDINKNNHIKDK